MKKLFLFSCILLSAIVRIPAQNNAADSLLNIINTTKVDTIKIIALKDLAFRQWQGNEIQIDDVLVMGVEI